MPWRRRNNRGMPEDLTLYNSSSVGTVTIEITAFPLEQIQFMIQMEN